MEILDGSEDVAKQRHGCVTAWLVLMLVVNSLSALLYLFFSEMVTNTFQVDVSSTLILLLGIVGIANVVFSVFLLQWKKKGFWGFLVTSIVTLIINMNIGVGIVQSMFGLVGIVILYGILQIKKDSKTAWENLD